MYVSKDIGYNNELLYQAENQIHGHCARGRDFLIVEKQDHLNRSHPGGRQFFLLRSKNPICETIGWIPVF
jgi:hypothetical protein